MKKPTVSCLYYPTTALLIDDNKRFLDNLSLKIGNHVACKTITDPKEAIRWINNAKEQDSILLDTASTDINSHDYVPSSGHLPIQFEISQLYKNVYDRKRFSEISVIIVDYAMPSMNGADLCKELSDSPIKKIMLTGESDEKLAVKLFNEGLIDRFIHKSEPNFSDAVNSTVLEMQKQYFHDLTSSIIKNLSLEEDSALGDPEFDKLFNSILQKTSASSYYLIEPTGSFVFFDDEGSPTWLIIKTQDELNEYAEQMEDADLPTKTIEAIRNGDLIFYFPSFDDYLNALQDDIGEHLHKAEKLKGNEKQYSYFLTNSLPNFPLNQEEIISFESYLDNVKK